MAGPRQPALAQPTSCGLRWKCDELRRTRTAVRLWLLVAIAYDGLVFVPVMHFGDYPIERPMLGLMLANPVDRARVLQLLQFDLSALLGYSGAVFQQLFSGPRGVAIASTALCFVSSRPSRWACGHSNRATSDRPSFGQLLSTEDL